MKRSIIKSSVLVFAAALLAAPGELFAQQPALDTFRPYDQAGINVFEPAQTDTVPFDGVKLRWGVGFTQQMQAIKHSNKAAAVVKVINEKDVNVNQLADIGTGFNLATANLNLNAQLADGVRLNLTTYLSSRHHPETWVKGGYLLVDKATFLNNDMVDNIMKYVFVKAGHMEINYGDAHFRRSDNGNAMFNPFVGNLIMDAFTTEVGGEVYFQNNGLLAMVGVTGGELNPSVIAREDKKPAFLAKVGYDKQMNESLRLRLTGSLYTVDGTARNTLYGGDRTGSRYYSVMENTANTGFTSGRINPGLTNKVTSVMINPFVKYNGLEFFGTYEITSGKALAETEERTWNQMAGEVIYRFLPREQAYVGARYNTLNGKLAPNAGGQEVTIDRVQIGGGWFMTRNILLKGEYVSQQYKGYAETNILHGGQFKGVVLEGVIAF